MKFWTSGRIDQQIESENFRLVMLEIEQKVNDSISTIDFGDIISSYDILVNIFVDQPNEKFRFSPKTKETDIDVNIDHNLFHFGDNKTKCTLYINSILHSINKMRLHRKLRQFNFDLFYDKVSTLLNDYQ